MGYLWSETNPKNNKESKEGQQKVSNGEGISIKSTNMPYSPNKIGRLENNNHIHWHCRSPAVAVEVRKYNGNGLLCIKYYNNGLKCNNTSSHLLRGPPPTSWGDLLAPLEGTSLAPLEGTSSHLLRAPPPTSWGDDGVSGTSSGVAAEAASVAHTGYVPPTCGGDLWFRRRDTLRSKTIGQ